MKRISTGAIVLLWFSTAMPACGLFMDDFTVEIDTGTRGAGRGADTTSTPENAGDDSDTGEPENGDTSSASEGEPHDGWSESFDVSEAQPLPEYDSRWSPIFGIVTLDPVLDAAVGDPGAEDDYDDYAYRATDTPTGSVEITLDFHWEGVGSVGTVVAVTEEPIHFYDATLSNGNLYLAYLVGPSSMSLDILETGVPDREVAAGDYRMVFRAILEDGVWQLTAILQNPENDFAPIVQVNASDDRQGPGGQGFGIWADGSMESGSYVSEIAVRPL